MSKLSRRKFIITAGATAAGTVILHGCSSGGNQTATTTTSPSPATSPAPVAASGDAPEVTSAKLGFIALTDSAPLIIAKEKGFFDKYGMTGVEVLKQASWPVTRDNLELGSGGGGIDGAHILSPMPYQMTLGTITKTKQPVPMYILARLNTNGQAISVGNNYKDLNLSTDAKALKGALEKAKAGGKQETKFAVTFPGGTHDMWMRYWLAANGIDPTGDVSVIPVPPPQMVANMKVGNMEAFCVGEPWNAQLVNQKAGYTALVTGELWADHPEKAFTIRKDWADQNPKATKALLMAVLEAQQWCDKAENKEEMCNIISQDKWFKVPVTDIIGRSQGQIDFGNGRVEKDFPLAMKFWANNASYPYKSHDLWFLTENIRWGYIPADTDTKTVIDAVNREDLWKEAATALGVPAAEIPTSSSRGVETFFDGVKFDPEKPADYLKSLKIKKA
ncbi:bicarbonate-binding protein [Aphanothece hegewaldii CCALA 016]|uniref:Bicarbonate-binding protein n=1 Tax=Aphanothece hegewaldii CCALA 016 TaxID=2107694 RepID=A0A2T1M250_9CHRO|nr:CmpA/NrtA family ABC transporter substrate-binding protein [Aphanothece hegewaldii]PSF38781.1 bicarbonate-binding protein [Aphanothece hegewaldii CCALA 016]